jgi:hypothetical protein
MFALVVLLVASVAWGFEYNHAWPVPYGNSLNQGFSHYSGSLQVGWIRYKEREEKKKFFFGKIHSIKIIEIIFFFTNLVFSAIARRENMTNWVVAGASGHDNLGDDPDVLYGTEVSNIMKENEARCARGFYALSLKPSPWSESQCTNEYSAGSQNPVLSDGILVDLCNMVVGSPSTGPYDSVCTSVLGPLPNQTSVQFYTMAGYEFLPGFAAIDPNMEFAVLPSRNKTSREDHVVSMDIVRPGPLTPRWVFPLGAVHFSPFSSPCLTSDHVLIALDGAVIALALDNGALAWKMEFKGAQPTVVSSDGKFAYFAVGGKVLALNQTGLTFTTPVQEVITLPAEYGDVGASISVKRPFGSTSTTLYIPTATHVVSINWAYKGAVALNTANWDYTLTPFEAGLVKLKNETFPVFTAVSLAGGAAVLSGPGIVSVTAVDAAKGLRLWTVYRDTSKAQETLNYKWSGPAAIGANGTVFHSSRGTLVSLHAHGYVSLAQVGLTVEVTLDKKDESASMLTFTWFPVPYTNWFQFPGWTLCVGGRGKDCTAVLVPTVNLLPNALGQLVYSVSMKADVDEVRGGAVLWSLTLAGDETSPPVDAISGNITVPGWKPATPSNKPSGGGGHKSNKGLVAGIVIMVLIIVAALPAGFVYWKKHSKTKEAYVAF